MVDVRLPDGSGLDLIRRVRAADGIASRLDPALPFIVLSGCASELDRVRGFERGADDYVTKPFAYRGAAAAGRGGAAALADADRAAGGCGSGTLEIDPAARAATVRGERVELAAKEFALLRTLAASPTRVFTKEELLREVWGFRSMGSTRTLDSHACRLRAKLRVARRRVHRQRVGRRLPARRRPARRGLMGWGDRAPPPGLA